MKQLSFFDAKKRYEKLTELGDPLEKLNSVMDWGIFRAKLTAVCQKGDKAFYADSAYTGEKMQIICQKAAKTISPASQRK